MKQQHPTTVEAAVSITGELESYLLPKQHVGMGGGDTCCIIKKGTMEGLLSHLNSVRPSIKFTVEVEKDGSLSFPDALLQRRDDGSLDVTVYRKPTHID